MLRIVLRNRHRRLSKAKGPCKGPQGRIDRLRELVTSLYRHERIEGIHFNLDEARGYAERLIQLAVENGDKHKKTMEVADYWLLEKDLVPKLFKVLVPRYQNYKTSFTSIYRLPTEYPGRGFPLAVLELKGNPWPPISQPPKYVKGSLLNVLLEEAQKDYVESSKRFGKWQSEGRRQSESKLNTRTEHD